MRPTLQTPSTRPYSTPDNINNIADYYVSSHTFIFDYISVADRMGSHYGQPFLQKPDLRQQASQSFVNIFCMFQIMLTQQTYSKQQHSLEMCSGKSSDRKWRQAEPKLNKKKKKSSQRL